MVLYYRTTTDGRTVSGVGGFEMYSRRTEEVGPQRGRTTLWKGKQNLETFYLQNEPNIG